MTVAYSTLFSHPVHKLEKTYWAQVEGVPTNIALDTLRAGVSLSDGPCAPAQVNTMSEPTVWPRDPPIRHRAKIPTAWLEITIREGRNRQVRRMTAAVGLPTLRLIRVRIGPWQLGKLLPGEYEILNAATEDLPAEWRKMLNSTKPSRKITKSHALVSAPRRKKPPKPSRR